MGVYRLWRDEGYAVGALIAGLLADALGGWWVGEIITPRILTGGALIVAGMLLAELGHLLKQRHEAEAVVLREQSPFGLKSNLYPGR